MSYLTSGRLSRPGQFIVLVSCIFITGEKLVRAAHEGDERESQTIFRYRTREGRVGYVNGLSRVPSSQRARAVPVDLSRISLNEQLATELRQAVDDQLTRLRATSHCHAVRALAERSWWRTAWERHASLVLLVGLIGIFLLLSPYLARTIGMTRWIKFAMVILSVCGFLGIGVTVAERTGRTMRTLRSAADPCQENQAETETPAATSRRVYMLQRLREQMEQAHTLRGRQLEYVLEEREGSTQLGSDQP